VPKRQVHNALQYGATSRNRQEVSKEFFELGRQSQLAWQPEKNLLSLPKKSGDVWPNVAYLTAFTMGDRTISNRQPLPRASVQKRQCRKNSNRKEQSEFTNRP